MNSDEPKLILIPPAMFRQDKIDRLMKDLIDDEKFQDEKKAQLKGDMDQ